VARVPLALPDPAALRARIDCSGRLAVKVTPGAREEGVVLSGDGVLVKVRAPAEKGAANQAAAQLLARALDVAPSRIELLRGATSRRKVFAVAL
jgi:uncharacterized protein YggU (UPF0235/DUF167 family)